MKAKQSTFWHPFLQTQWRNLSASNNKVQCVSTWASDNTGQCVSIQSLVKLAVPEVLPRVAQFGVDVILCLNSPTLASGDALLSLPVYYRFPNISEAMLRGSQPSPICLTVLWRQRLCLICIIPGYQEQMSSGSYERSQLLNENWTWYLLYFLYLWRASLCGIWWFLWQNSSFQNMSTMRAGVNGSCPWSEFAQPTLYIWVFYIHRCHPL